MKRADPQGIVPTAACGLFFHSRSVHCAALSANKTVVSSNRGSLQDADERGESHQTRSPSNPRTLF